MAVGAGRGRISRARPAEAEHSSSWDELQILVLASSAGINRAWVLCKLLLEQL